MNAICIFAAAIEFAIGPGTQEKPSAAFPLKLGEKPSAVWYDAEALHVGSSTVPWGKPVWRRDGFSCWNREVRLGGNGLVSSVVSAGREILSAPVEVLWNGKPLKFVSSLAKANVADAFYELKAEGAPVSARIRAEFDGVMWFELSYEPSVDSLSVAVPTSSAIASSATARRHTMNC